MHCLYFSSASLGSESNLSLKAILIHLTFDELHEEYRLQKLYTFFIQLNKALYIWFDALIKSHLYTGAMSTIAHIFVEEKFMNFLNASSSTPPQKPRNNKIFSRSMKTKVLNGNREQNFINITSTYQFLFSLQSHRLLSS